MSKPHRFTVGRRSSRGFSLVELMVTIAIGMLIVASMAILLSNNSQSRTETEKTSQKIENGRYAIEALAGEIQNAGYYAEFDPRNLTMPASKPDACATAAADIAAAMRLHVQGYNDVTSSTLSCLTDVKAGTDVLVVRRASGCVAGVGDCAAVGTGNLAFQASSCGASGELGSATVTDHFKLSATTSTFTLTKYDCTTVAEIRRFHVRIYYVANNDRAGDGIPTLKRAELTNGAFAAISLVQGVENLQIEYGLDLLPSALADGAADVYTPAPDLYNTCAAAACVQNWASVVTAKISVLTRNREVTAGHVDNKTYVLGRNADGTNAASGTDKTVGPVGDAYKRSTFQSLVRFYGPAGRTYSTKIFQETS